MCGGQVRARSAQWPEWARSERGVHTARSELLDHAVELLLEFGTMLGAQALELLLEALFLIAERTTCRDRVHTLVSNRAVRL